ncbi:MAG: 23S rRNA (adenine(2503)-C(2))-methyltransferase RlmN [Oscillospiraceae bacterium]|nr:23S rRNA (adenine(2503)-C(2))-methyltransferase RlmN [Oscillospiraceae bacterium]
MTDQKTDLLGLTPEELAAFLKELGEPGYRAGQIFGWLHGKLAASFDEMHNLPGPLRVRLQETCEIGGVSIEKRLASSIDGTVKYLYGATGGDFVEGALMRHRHGNSLCISSQVGCRMACAFCASALGGLSRNLTPGEMLGQVYASARDLASGGTEIPDKIGSVVLMGIGEPLDNFENVCRFLELLSHPEGFGLSLRRVSLSTCGLVDGIRKLAKKNYPLTLSISLHATNDEARSRIMPVNRKHNLADLMAACRDYFAKTGRRISFEYCLICGENDSPADAQALAALLKGQNCHLNLIPLNSVSERDFARPDPAGVRGFQTKLEQLGVSVTLRRELGADIAAACGQLRRRANDNK